MGANLGVSVPLGSYAFCVACLCVAKPSLRGRVLRGVSNRDGYKKKTWRAVKLTMLSLRPLREGLLNVNDGRSAELKNTCA
jgi:hypothetical protein